MRAYDFPISKIYRFSRYSNPLFWGLKNGHVIPLSYWSTHPYQNTVVNNFLQIMQHKSNITAFANQHHQLLIYKPVIAYSKKLTLKNYTPLPSIYSPLWYQEKSNNLLKDKPRIPSRKRSFLVIVCHIFLSHPSRQGCG